MIAEARDGMHNWELLLRMVRGLTRLLLGLIKAAIPSSLEDSKQEEAT